MGLTFQFFELVHSLTEAVDLVSPVVADHHKLVGYIAYSLAAQLDLTEHQQLEIEIAGSLHDIGGLSLLERLAPTEFEYHDLDCHAEKGYLLLGDLKQCADIAKMIRYHHRSWQNGKCMGFDDETIPFASHILNLADRVAVLGSTERENILSAVNVISQKITAKKTAFFTLSLWKLLSRLRAGIVFGSE